MITQGGSTVIKINNSVSFSSVDQQDAKMSGVFVNSEKTEVSNAIQYCSDASIFIKYMVQNNKKDCEKIYIYTEKKRNTSGLTPFWSVALKLGGYAPSDMPFLMIRLG